MKTQFKALFRIPIIFILLLSLIGCEKDPITFALHNPIYPAADEAVNYTLERVTEGNIISAELYELVVNVESNGNMWTVNPETLLQSWNNPSGDLSFSKTDGYNANQMVTYRWVVKTEDEDGERTKQFKITYAIRPYPVTDAPAPVYIQGDPEDVFDVVFIPDNDITNLATFRNHCRNNIRDAYFEELAVRTWRKQFNFYINPFRGTATDYDRRNIDGPHVLPSNNAQLAFMEGRCLMHQNNLRDWASGGVFSTEMQNRGTILHESGHALFGLADEYVGGSHWESADFGNMWDTEAEAEDAANDYGSCKSDADINNFDTGWWKLCVNQCQMLTTGLDISFYDCPCDSHIDNKVLDNAIN